MEWSNSDAEIIKEKALKLGKLFLNKILDSLSIKVDHTNFSPFRSNTPQVTPDLTPETVLAEEFDHIDTTTEDGNINERFRQL